MSKELWLQEFNRLIQKFEDEGYNDSEAYDLASEAAHDAVSDRLAAAADYERKRRREEP